MTDDDKALVERLQELFKRTTPGDLATAERHILSEYVECPMCSGDGEVGATDYCNFDGVALGVQFYGIGKEFGAHEKLWSELIKSAPVLMDRIEALNAENERKREELAAVYVKLSGRTEHASDCATSNAPAKDPGPCDCGPPDDVRRAIEVELAMTAIANEDASSDWIDGFEHAWKRVRAALGNKK